MSKSHFDGLVDLANRAVVPLTVQIELTGRCNLACQHCYLDSKRPPDELSAEQWKRVLDELAAMGTLFITLTGGELFLRPDVFDIAEHARALGMALRVLTSGTRTSRADVDRLAALRPLSVELSLYSARAAVHDAITRRRGSHRKTLRTAVALRRRNVPVVLKAPILRPNLGEIRGVLEVAKRIGAEYTFDPMTIIRRDGRGDPRALRPDADELAGVLADPELRSNGLPLIRPPRDRSSPICAIARRVAVILPNGDVMPCSLHPQPAGNLRERRFRDIWTQSPVLLSLRATTIEALHAACSTCDKNGYCGRCSALALLEEGDFHGPSRAACNLAGARERAAGAASCAPAHTTQSHGRASLTVLR